MLHITVEANELWDERSQKFLDVPKTTLALEHSLVSISKWEAKWNKPFLSSNDKTYEEIQDYIRCMTITQNVKPEVYFALSDENYRAINDYIQKPMTATWFNDPPGSKSKTNNRIITNELIYHWMFELNIPFECHKWNLNRLLTLIRVCKEEREAASGSQKMKKKDILSENARLNAARRKALGTKG